MEEFKQHQEPFEVVMCKKGVSSLSARPADFKRVPVMASNTLEALMSDEVAKENGHQALFAAKPGVMTDPEVLARVREAEMTSTTDRVNI